MGSPRLQNTDAYSAYVRSLEARIVQLEEVNKALTEQRGELCDRLDRLEGRIADLDNDVRRMESDYDY